MWRLGRKKDTKAERIARLEAGRAEDRRMLDALTAVARAAGAEVESAADDAVPGVPAGLIAATRSPRPGGEPVMLTSRDGQQVIAVVTGDGDPRQWWNAINERASS